MDDAHGLIVGVANYRTITPLPETVLADARDIHAVVTNPRLCAYPPGNVALLLDDRATLDGIRRALAELAARSTDRSTVFVFVSGHGGRVEAGPHAGEYLLPVDTDLSSDATLAATALAGAELTAALRAIRARKLVVVFDCCHAGGIGQPKSASAPLLGTLSESYYDTLSGGFGRVILASSRSTEFSYVMPGHPNSLFTHHFLGALRGGAPGPGGVIRIFDVFNYLQPRVLQDQPAQHPIFKAEIEDNFPIALHLGGKAAEVVAPAVVPEPAVVAGSVLAVPGPVAAQPPPSLTAARAAEPLPYDVFLSYRSEEPDRSWVRRVLRPRLEAAGIRTMIDHRDFRLGEPLVLEMARAVEQSRYTLAVLTPAYLESNFTELESVLAEHLGLERSERRLLAVMREASRPRLGMRSRLWLDMTDDSEFGVNVERLIYELSLPSGRTSGS